MKYSPLNMKNTLHYDVPFINGGLALDAPADMIEDNRLSGCENMWLYKGRLSTRPGIRATGSNIKKFGDETPKKELNITDTVYYKNGQRCFVAYLTSRADSSTAYMYVYLVNNKGTASGIGKITFTAESEDLFYQPERVFFVSADPTVGAGLYAFVTTASGTQQDYRIFELTKNQKSWKDVGDRYYVPTVYINGTGTSYAEAKELYNVSYESPQRPEEINLLTGRFKAYFTSDGVSSSFRLPITNLDDSSIVCRFYSNSQDYTEWKIPAGKTIVAANFSDREIEMKCDRVAGMIHFSMSGAGYSLPIRTYCPRNNLVIEAEKSVADGKARVIGSGRSTTFNNRFYLYNNSVKPNDIYSARLSNPLYFPKGSAVAVGESTDPVSLIAVQNNKLIAFKSGEIYRINTAENRAIGGGTVFESPDNFSDTDTLSTQAVHTGIGCDLPKTAALCGNRLVWADSSGKVYTLATTTYGKENNIYEVSQPLGFSIAESSQNLSEAVAVENNGYYTLFCGNKVWLMYCRVKGFGYSSTVSGESFSAENISWYSWTLPSSLKINSAVCVGGKVLLSATAGSGYLNYILSLSGDKDRLLEGDKNNSQYKEYDINTSFSTKLFDFGLPHIKKCIDSLHIVCEGDAAINVTVTDGENKRKQICKSTHGVIKIIPRISRAVKFGLQIQSDRAINFGKILFKYRKISDVR